MYKACIEAATGLPALVAADVECGPGKFEGYEPTPYSMALGAADDPEAVERMHRACAEICRKAGINWTFSPVVDINTNPDNPVTNIRAISDNADKVIKIASAQIRGFQKDGLVMSACKHFPGDGTDDRNQHFCTTVNRLTADEWMNTFGKVYRAMFETGVASVMVAHICLPALQDAEEYDEILGYRPASLSYSLQTKLLKERLGFKGCIVSDAMSMVGACAVLPDEKLAVEFLKSGGDMLLFPVPEDFDRIKKAVEEGELSIERLKDAVTRVLRLKEQARLFEKEETVFASMKGEFDVQKETDMVTQKAVKIVRNSENIVPLTLKKGAKILSIQILSEKDKEGLPEIEKELKKRGYQVDTWMNPKHYAIKENMQEYDCILVNCKLSCHSYPGGSLRAGWEHVSCFWRGYIFRHPKVIFTSFGDPYKLYDFPFLKTYINTFCDSPASQRGFVKILLGEAQPEAKNPVTLKGFFETEI